MNSILCLTVFFSIFTLLTPIAFAEETKTIFIGPNLVDCVGVGPQKCMQIREDQTSEWQNFYDKIEGFDFETGYNYKVTIQITDVENPPADASSKKYSLVEIIEKNSTNRHIPYKNMCAPGFVPLGQICVLNDRCGPGAYPGKICVMDNKVQPYLKPLKQGHAGIPTENVICAETLELVFKHDASPACVKPETKTKLEMRGWYLEKPPIACTKEYSPVCGVDNKTYGNMCTLNAEHMGFKHQGECKTILQPVACTLEYNPVCGMDGQTYGNMCMLTAAKIELKHQGECKDLVDNTSDEIFDDILQYASMPPVIDEEKGYVVTEIANGVYWLVGSGYQTIFLTTGNGVVVVDAPQPIGENYLEAIKEVTEEQITYMIYSHHHQDHTGAAGQIFPEDIIFIAHQDAANLLASDNDPNRPIPNMVLEGDFNSLEIGDKTIEFYNIGDFHSKGNLLIILPENKVAMLVDLLRPAESPYRAFGVTPDIDVYLETHDKLQNFDFDVLITGHTELLATKKHIQQNKQFTLDVMANAQDAIDGGVPDPTQYCVDTTIEQWKNKLGNLDTFMADHCDAMLEYLSSQ